MIPVLLNLQVYRCACGHLFAGVRGRPDRPSLDACPRCPSGGQVEPVGVPRPITGGELATCGYSVATTSHIHVCRRCRSAWCCEDPACVVDNLTKRGSAVCGVLETSCAMCHGTPPEAVPVAAARGRK